MTEVAVIRHAPTAWNRQGRLQGRRDVALDANGWAEVARWSAPAALDGFRWMCSPLRRCRETARGLGARDVAVDDRLIERDWGEWEGQSLRALRRARRDEFKQYEKVGPDFRPPGGETHVEVLDRVQSWLRDVATDSRPTAAVSHKGVIYAVYAIATGWDFRGRPLHDLDWASAHLFTIDDVGHPRVQHLNLSLREACA